MFFVQMWKEIKVFFTSKGNLLFMFVMPLLLISIFSFALRDYISADYGTFDDGRVYYYLSAQNEARIGEFEEIKEKMTGAIGISFEQVYDYEEACCRVESSEAYGVITIKDDGYDYFRSTFNEPEGGKLARTLFSQIADNYAAGIESQSSPAINKVRVEVNKLDSRNYYTFAGLAFSIIFMGLLVAFMVYDEKEFGTIERIKLGGAGISSMVISKVLTGVVCGLVMIATSFAYSRTVLKVDWGNKAGYIVTVLLCLVIFSAVFGCVVGLWGKNRTMCQSSVLMFSMLCGYLGGSITPLYLLENMPVL
ncbi:MAG: ABC transporter permease, partial [Lachnospiraceae bacterium]|nr:ABC transporter permease [Lachnospiraceae bacterium]